MVSTLSEIAWSDDEQTADEQKGIDDVIHPKNDSEIGEPRIIELKIFAPPKIS